MAKVADQATQRRYQKFRDQHARPWGANVEIRNGHPTGAWDMMFRAPLVPDAKYLEFDETNPGRITINYPRWIDDLQEARKAYVDKGRRYGFTKYGALFDPNKPFTEEVLLHIGPPPQPVEPVQWAAKGNRWVLGLLSPDGQIPLMPERLAEFFRVPEEEDLIPQDDYLDAAPELVDEPLAATVPEVLYTTKAQTQAPKRRGRPSRVPAEE